MVNTPKHIEFPPNLSLSGVIASLYEMPANLDLDNGSEIPANLRTSGIEIKQEDNPYRDKWMQSGEIKRSC